MVNTVIFKLKSVLILWIFVYYERFPCETSIGLTPISCTICEKVLNPKFDSFRSKLVVILVDKS